MVRPRVNLRKIRILASKHPFANHSSTSSAQHKHSTTQHKTTMNKDNNNNTHILVDLGSFAFPLQKKLKKQSAT